MYLVGKIDIEIYNCITKDITTDEVIITDKQIDHIKNRHPNDYELFNKYFEKIVEQPDYIIEANKPFTALILKEIQIDNKKFKTVVRLATSNRILKNKKILYKSE